jgi:hypothetical protein
VGKVLLGGRVGFPATEALDGSEFSGTGFNRNQNLGFPIEKGFLIRNRGGRLHQRAKQEESGKAYGASGEGVSFIASSIDA